MIAQHFPWKPKAPLTELNSVVFPLLLLQGPPSQTDGSLPPIGSASRSQDRISGCQSGGCGPGPGTSLALGPGGCPRGWRGVRSLETPPTQETGRLPDPLLMARAPGACVPVCPVAGSPSWRVGSIPGLIP